MPIATRNPTTLSAILAAALAAGPAAAQDRAPVSFWYEQADPATQKALNETLVVPFNAAHPDAELTLEFRGDTLDRQLRVALLSGSGPDVVLTPGPSYVATMAQAGQLLPLDDYAQRFGWTDRILPFFLDIGAYDGKLYSLPKTYEAMHLFYNATLFEANGWSPPQTLGALESLAQAMQDKGIIPFGAGNANWRAANEWYVTLVLNHYAGPDNVYQALKGELPWTAPVFVEAIDLLKGWFEAGWFGEDYFSLTTEQAMNQTATGRAGMSPNGTWGFQWLPGLFGASGMKPAIVPFPPLRDGVPHPLYALGIGSTLSINKNAKNPGGAAQAIDAIFTVDFLDRISHASTASWNIPLQDISAVDFAGAVSPAYAETIASLAAAVDGRRVLDAVDAGEDRLADGGIALLIAEGAMSTEAVAVTPPRAGIRGHRRRGPRRSPASIRTRSVAAEWRGDRRSAPRRRAPDQLQPP